MQILFLFYVVAHAIHLDNPSRGPAPLDFIALRGAYIAEIIRAGIESVGAIASWNRPAPLG